jgi:hypothetical protein
MDIVFSHRHKHLTASDIAFIRELIATHPTLSRHALSKELCRAWNWVQPNGALRDMVCRTLMLQLHREGHIQLPAVRRVMHNPLAQRRVPALISVDTQPLRARLSEIQPLQLCQVRRTPQEALFNSLIAQHHYLGYSQPVGEHLKFLFYAGQRPIACLAWSSAPRHLGGRDRYIGWGREARLKNIRLLAYNTRFLILPEVST